MLRKIRQLTAVAVLLAGFVLPDYAVLSAAEEVTVSEDHAASEGAVASPAQTAPEGDSEATGSGYLIGSFTIIRGDYPTGARNFHLNRYEVSYREFDPERGPPAGLMNALNKALGDTPSAMRSDETHGTIGAHGNFLTNKYPEDFDSEEGAGTVFALPLPPGKYEFYKYYMFQSGGTAQIVWKPHEEFSIPFEIQAGRATYIGEVRAVNLFEKNMFGIKLSDGARFEVKDAYERDAPILATKFAVLSGVPVDSAVLAEGFAGIRTE